MAGAEVKASNIVASLPPKSSSKSGAWLRQHISRPMGFNKLYNVPLFIIFAGALLGFSLARLSYLDIDGGISSYSVNAAPGEWFHMKDGRYRIGITLHLATVLPMGLLVVWQFLPIIRHKLLILHRINGYLVVLLALLSNVGALMIADRAFGGNIDTQAGVGLLAILTTVSIFMAYYNIKRLQVDQHRAWMLRTFFYYGTIVTLRIIMIISAQIITITGGFYQVQSCEQLLFILKSPERTAQLYPICASSDPSTPVPVAASFGSSPESIGASLDVSFGMALWLALFLHLVGVEIYLRLTPAESDRLRQVSYEKQLEAGMKHPGSAGLTSDRWGDAEPWKPSSERSGSVATLTKQGDQHEMNL